MKKKIIAIIAAFITVLTLSAVTAFADEPADMLQLTLKATGSDSTTPLHSTQVDGKDYFFLPSGVKDENIEKDFAEGEQYETMQSSNIGSVHFFSKDPKKGMSYVHDSKDNKAKGTLQLYDKDFVLQYEGEVDALKCRGNTTYGWTNKKSYQIKLDKKADLLDSPDGEQKAKKWILLANPFDPTLIRNSMIYAFGKEIGLETTPEGRPVDVYYDGEYRGSYYLCEKVEIGEGRVDIHDLEKDVEEANEGVDFDDLQVVQEKNSLGYDMQYVEGINNPEDITGSYLLEVDPAYYNEEKSWFQFGTIPFAVSKSPEYLSREMTEYISKLVTDMYAYVKNESQNYRQGKDLFKYIDKETFVKYWIVNEWFATQDVWVSSTFMYKPQGEDLFYNGPIWDCDASLQIRSEGREYAEWFGHGMSKYLRGLPEFRKAVKETYKTEVRPVIYDTLLGTKEGRYLKPATELEKELADSLAMNYMIWDINNCDNSYFPKDTVEANYEDIYSWMQKRAEWFDKQVMSKGFTSNKVTVKKTLKVNTKVSKKKRTCQVTFAKTKYVLDNTVIKSTKYAKKYQVAYKTSKAKKWKKSTTSKRSFTIKKMKKGKIYQVKVRAVVKYNGKTYYGPWSKIKKAKIK